MRLLNEMRFSGENIYKYDGLISTLDREFAVAIVIVENVFLLCERWVCFGCFITNFSWILV